MPCEGPSGAAFKENVSAQYYVTDVISMLELFNTVEYPNDGGKHPTGAYREKSQILKRYLRNQDTFKRLEPILNDILVLHDVIAKEARTSTTSTSGTSRRGHAEAAEPRPITMHECRHTYASLLIDAGANPKAIQTYLGHSKIQTTFDTYRHLIRIRFGAALSGNGFRPAICGLQCLLCQRQNGTGCTPGFKTPLMPAPTPGEALRLDPCRLRDRLEPPERGVRARLLGNISQRRPCDLYPRDDDQGSREAHASSRRGRIGAAVGCVG